jgi:hypothetical protein
MTQYERWMAEDVRSKTEDARGLPDRRERSESREERLSSLRLSRGAGAKTKSMALSTAVVN